MMADRINSDPAAGIYRVRTVTEQRWRERTEAADNPRDSKKRKGPRKRQDTPPQKGGGIDEFA